MNSSMLLNRTFIIAAVIAPGAFVLWFQHQSAAGIRDENSTLRSLVEAVQHDFEARSSKTTSQSGASAARLAHSFRSQPPLPAVKDTPHADKPLNGGIAKGSSDIPYVSLSKTNLKSLSLKPFSDAYQVTDEAAAVLGLSNEERSTVNQTLARLIAKHEQLDLQNIRQIEEHLSTEEGRKTSFKVAAYPEQGKVMAEEVLASMQQAIGATRADLLFHYADFHSLSAEGFEPFGRTEKTITFVDRENPDGTRGDCRIQMRVTDTATGLTLSTGFPNQDDAIPKNWRHLIQNLAPGQGTK